jgi:radical SAM superfamily enzyme YgiQ (UPF0313 family)
MRVFLADLGHNLLTISSDVYPLGVADLATYLQAYARTKQPLDITLFREPQDLKTAIDKAPPDVLGLSSYAWNHNLSCNFARYVKARSKATLTIMGGPNFPLTVGEQATFLRGMPEIDVFIQGPTYEGERAFLNCMNRLDEVGCAIEGLQEEPVPGSFWINRRTGEFEAGGEVTRIRDLDEIPSPYLAGLMDPFFKTGYFPMLQIARGCPFSCTFCNSGVDSNNKIFAHSIENVKADLTYIAERVKPELPVCFADDNFGMYKRDEEVADYIAYLQDRYNWPKYVRTTTGKNNGERIIRVMRKTRGALPMTAAVQSMNPVVLRNIKRDNIKLETYAQIQDELNRQGMQAYGELILCLPGETRQTFMKAVEDLLDAGAKRVSAHQLMLLHGAELSNPDSRRQFGFGTRFRLVARDVGNYTGEPVAEVEEMVVETPDFSFADYLKARVFHLLLTIFYYEGNFEEPFQLAKQGGVKAFDLMMRMQKMLPGAPLQFHRVIDDFVRESQEELFKTKEECLAWTYAHYDQVVDGTLGGNLLSKYSMIGRFYATQPALDFLGKVISAALAEKGTLPDPDELHTVMGFMRAVMLHAPFADAMTKQVCWQTAFDVEGWIRDGYARPLKEYRFFKPRTFEAAVSPGVKKMIETKIKTFGEHPSGLGKFTRTLFARDLRRTLVHAQTGSKALVAT